MEFLYILLSTMIFLFLAIIWETKTLLNVSLKFIFSVWFIYGLINVLYQMGFLVKIK